MRNGSWNSLRTLLASWISWIVWWCHAAETDLETSIISNLQKFLMELDKGYFSFARQQHIRTEKQDYYIDPGLLQLHSEMLCLVDLKTEKITHQDVGQMDMYIRMNRAWSFWRGDNQRFFFLFGYYSADIARYSILNGNEAVRTTATKLYLPTEEELRAEIETQKANFYLQQRARIGYNQVQKKARLQRRAFLWTDILILSKNTWELNYQCPLPAQCIPKTASKDILVFHPLIEVYSHTIGTHIFIIIA